MEVHKGNGYPVCYMVDHLLDRVNSALDQNGMDVSDGVCGFCHRDADKRIALSFVVFALFDLLVAAVLDRVTNNKAKVPFADRFSFVDG